VKSAEKCFSVNKTGSLFELLRYDKCKDNNCLKMELILNRKIQYLCDVFSLSPSKSNIRHYLVILYYRFEHNGTKYLFVKLEGHPMNSLRHVKELLDKRKKDTYDKRREDEKPYEGDLKDKDNKFYESLLDIYNFSKRILRRINNYNKTLRTGRELFIFEELKELLLGKLLDIHTKKLESFIQSPFVDV